MLDKEFISLFTEKTVTQLLNAQDLNLLTGLGRKRLSNNIDLLNSTYLFNQEELLTIDHFDLTNINIEKVLVDYSHSVVLPDDFRKMILYLIIYIQDEAYSILELQESLEVSRNTIIADLKKLNNDLDNVTVRYDRKKGYVLQGDELAIRKVALFYIFTLYKELEIKTVLIERCGISKGVLDEWLEITYQSLKVNRLNIMTGQISEIVIFIIMTALRKQHVTEKLDVTVSAKELPKDKYLEFCACYSELLPEQGELNYLSLIFAAISQEELIEPTHRFVLVFKEFLTMFNVISGIDVLNDQELVLRLKLHTIAMMYREKYFLFLENQLIETIGTKNQSLNNVLQEALTPIELEIGKKLV